MDKIAIYSIHDLKAGKFDVPFFAANDLFANRKFQLMTKEEGTILNQWKSEFNLVRIGWLDVNTGIISPDNYIVVEGKQILKGDN